MVRIAKQVDPGKKRLPSDKVITIQLTGTTEMMMHNKRLANPLDPYTCELRKLNTIKGKDRTDEILAKIASVEARGGCYETKDGLLAIEMEAAYASIRDAAKAYKLGKEVTRSLLWKSEAIPIFVDGKKWKCDDWLKRQNAFDYRSVVINGRRVMRARPLIPAGWTAKVSFIAVESVLEELHLPQILERAGRYCGLYEYRPIYGQYEAKIL